MTPAFLRFFSGGAFVLASLALASGCQDTAAVYALIGPEGGEVAIEDGPTLVIPPNALVTTRQIVIRRVDDDLSRGSFKQSGSAYRIEPTGLDLRIPARLTFDGDQPKQPTILWRRGEGRVVAHAAADDRAVAYIGALGVVALAAGGDGIGTVDEPQLARTPEEVDYGAPFVNAAQIKVTPKGTLALDVGFTVYDPMGVSNRPLNGDGSRYCGLKFASVQGGSITAGCSGGLATGSVSVNSPQVVVEAEPFLIGKTEGAMLVEVQLGSSELAHSVGYFAFTTSPCYLESCSGRGVCDDSSGKAECICNEGYAPGEGLVCNCVPQCDGRECGSDGCGGQCGACGPDATCEDGICEPLPPPETTSGPDTTGPDTTGTTGTTGPDTTGPDTTTEPDTTSTTDPDPDTSTSTSTTGTSTTDTSSTT